LNILHKTSYKPYKRLHSLLMSVKLTFPLSTTILTKTSYKSYKRLHPLLMSVKLTFPLFTTILTKTSYKSYKRLHPLLMLVKLTFPLFTTIHLLLSNLPTTPATITITITLYDGRWIFPLVLYEYHLIHNSS